MRNGDEEDGPHMTGRHATVLKDRYRSYQHIEEVNKYLMNVTV